jgi:hypothetical protein
MENKKFNPNLFLALDMPTDFELVIGEDFKEKSYFIYQSPDNQWNAKLYGNPKTTGIYTNGLVHESDGRYSLEIFGKPRLGGKNTMQLRFSNRTEYQDFEISFHVKNLKFLDYTLPDALGLGKKYSTRIHFYNPSNLKPKFMYNFPVEFGRVETESDDGVDYTTITLYPTKAGKFKFHVTALSEDNIEMGSRTMNLKVIDIELPKVQSENTFNKVRAVDIKDWK